MEAEPDNFLKVLQKRQRNLTKKLDRIKKKQAELKSGNKEMKEEEKKMLESAPQVEELLAETDKLIQQYQKHVGGPQKEQKKPQPKPEDDRIGDLIQFWLVGEFLRNPQIKEKFIRESSNGQDLDAFLLLHSQARGQAGETLAETLSNVTKSMDLYLLKSDKIAPGTMRAYRKLSEFTAQALSWCLTQQRPNSPVKNELIVQAGPVYSTQTKPEKKAPVPEPEEVKVETRPEAKAPEVKQSPQYEASVPVSSWADDKEEDEWAEKEEPRAEKVEGKVSKNAEDEGFIEVTGRKPKAHPKGEAGAERDGGRGRRGGRRGRRFREGPRNN